MCFRPKSSRKKIGTTFLRLFLNAMIRNMKIHNVLILLRFQKSMEPNKCIQKDFNENVHLSVSYDFSRFDGSRKIKV